MNTQNRETATNPLIEAAKNQTLSRKLKKYVRECRPPPDADPKRDTGRLPNFAGFCGSLGCGLDALNELKNEMPSDYAYLCAVLEDEALNSTRSATIVGAYLKEKFGYGTKSEGGNGQVRLLFEHDILEDGA